MKLNPFQKNFLFVIAVLGGLGTIGFVGKQTVHLIQWRQASVAKARVERLMRLNICAHFTDGERARLDRELTDPVRSKEVLLAIHKERLETWANNTNAMWDDRESRLDSYLRAFGRDKGYIAFLNQIDKGWKEAMDQKYSFKEAVERITLHDVNAPFETPKPAKSGGQS